MTADIITLPGVKMPNNSDTAKRGVSLSETLEKILEQSEKNNTELAALRTEVADVADLLQAWRNARGLVRTIHTLGRVAVWSASVAASFAAIGYLIKTGGWKL